MFKKVEERTSLFKIDMNIKKECTQQSAEKSAGLDKKLVCNICAIL